MAGRPRRSAARARIWVVTTETRAATNTRSNAIWIVTSDAGELAGGVDVAEADGRRASTS